MKKRSVEPEQLQESPVRALCRALLTMEQVEEMEALLHDLCTPAELEALSDRWRVIPYLLVQMPYREIHDRTSVSVTTIGRVARCLSEGDGGYQLAVKRLKRRGSWVEPQDQAEVVAVKPKRTRGARS
jgi:TrpR-related protein YerC/YecD